jgi:hypothetical protein
MFEHTEPNFFFKSWIENQEKSDENLRI